MNPRQRILAALAHKEPDCLPIDFGGMRSTGINTLAYVRLKKHLGIKTGQVRVYDLFQQLAEPEETVLKRMGGDVLQLHRLAPSFGIPIDEWKEFSLADGSPCLVPAGFNPVRLPNNDLGIFKGDTLIAKMPAKGYYFDLVNFPYAGCRSKQDIDRIPLMEISSRELDFLAANARSLFEKTDYALLGAFGGNILEAENILLGRDQIRNLLLGRLRLRGARQGFDQILFQLAEGDRLLGDFAQRDDRVLVVVARDGQLFPAADIAGTLRREQNQLEAVRNLLNAVFNGHARHAPILQPKRSGKLPV